MRDEFRRRLSLEDRLFHFILEHPHVWLDGRDMRPVGGDAWRSRLTNIRRRLAAQGLEFACRNKNKKDAAYLLRAVALGPLAETHREQQGLF